MFIPSAEMFAGSNVGRAGRLPVFIPIFASSSEKCCTLYFDSSRSTSACFNVEFPMYAVMHIVSRGMSSVKPTFSILMSGDFIFHLISVCVVSSDGVVSARHKWMSASDSLRELSITVSLLKSMPCAMSFRPPSSPFMAKPSSMSLVSTFTSSM